MTAKTKQNLFILAIAWVVVTTAGAYLTFVQQPRELERVEKAEKVMRLKQAEVAALLAEVAVSETHATEAVRKWNARYKVIPQTLTSPEVVGYLNDLTRSGFESFDITLGGIQRRADYSYYSFRVTGEGYFTSLYRFIWEIENNRRFYRIRDLSLSHVDLLKKDRDSGKEHMKVMVTFDFVVDAYFGGTEGVSAPTMMAAGQEGEGVMLGALDAPPIVPAHVLPTQRLPINPFFPVVMEKLPPNTHNLVDIERARLVAIVGDEAVFQDEGGFRRVGVGGAIYLGQVVVVDPQADRVVARLNKGGIIDEVEMTLHAGAQFRQALGPVRLAPTTAE